MSKSTLRRLGKTMRDDDALEFLADNFPCVANLLRVARAGKGARYQLQMYGDESAELFELMEALKKVEHLL